MRIGVDGNLLCGKKTGMGIVVASILKNLELNKEKVTVFVPEDLDIELTKLFEKRGIEIVNCGTANYFKWEQLVLPRAVKKYKIDVLWCPYNTAPLKISCPTVVTVHDVIYMSSNLNDVRSLYKKAGLVYRRLVVPKAIQKAKKIVTISNYAKQAICECFPEAKNKIQIVYNSTDFDFTSLNKTDEQKFFQNYGIKKPYILGFGSLESRKNSLGLIKAYGKMNVDIREKYQLVLFGFRGYRDSKEYVYINDNHLKNVIVLDYITDAQKNCLYKNSSMFVFPTLSEGFGIPVLEAYANGSPVITSNVTSLPEVAGEAAMFINHPSNVDELCIKMEKLLLDEKKRYDMSEKGKEQLAKFDWKISADKMLSILNEVENK